LVTLRDEHVDNLAVLVDRAVNVAPHAVDLGVCLVDEPPITERVTDEAGRIGDQGANRCTHR
jgi:putative NIF3 family GTP cyclohydrolase 1 type 2